MNLRLDWCSYEAAKHAVMNWHYSKTMPVGKLVKIGVWEDNKYVGVIIYSRGASRYLGKAFNCSITEVCELTRISLSKHFHPVSRMVSISHKMIKKLNPGLKLIISFADPRQKHLGKIYQAGNWVYTGKSPVDKQYLVNGKWTHPRSIGAKYGTRKTEFIEKMGFITRVGLSKHRYLYPLNQDIRKQIEPLAKPYPKKNCDSGVNRSTPSFQDGGGGADPTESLYNYAQS